MTYNLASFFAEWRRSEAKQSLPRLRQAANSTLPGLTLNRLRRLSLGYSHANWEEVVALAAALGVAPETLAGIAPQEIAAATLPPPLPVTQSPPAGEAAAIGLALPPTEPPGRGSMGATEYRGLLGAELQRALAVQQTPNLPAADWAGWRAYEKQVRTAFADIGP